MNSRLAKIAILAGNGDIAEVRNFLSEGYNQVEINVALENAIAYSRISVAEYLIAIGAEISANEYQGVYYSVHNNELEGLKFALKNGVDINVNSGMLLNCSIQTAINKKDVLLVEWLLENGADIKLLTADSRKLLRDYSFDTLTKLMHNVT